MPSDPTFAALDLDGLDECELELFTVEDAFALPEMGATLPCSPVSCTVGCSCSGGVCLPAPVEER